jgi:hypothetical protein
VKQRKPGPLLGLIAVLAVTQGVVQQKAVLPMWYANYYDKMDGDLTKLSPDHFLAVLGGFRQLIGDILWVQANKYFDDGNYDAVLPITRLVSILNPHDIDVFVTGTWHMAYNFTDEESRSDRRYIPSALAFIREGCEKNPETYELPFETAWTWYHKVDDNYPEAVKWMELAMTKKDVLDTPMRRNLLTNIYLRDGQVEKARDYMNTLYVDAVKNREKDTSFTGRTAVDTIEQNLDNMLIRMAQRGFFAKKGGYFDQYPYDVKPPHDVKFGIKISVIDERLILAEGNWGVQTLGTRLRLIVRDADYPDALPGGVAWEKGSAVELTPKKGITYMQEQLFIRDMRFNKRVDMSRDPTMYPFQKPKYVIEVYYNPRSAPNHIQDRFGWNGEGMTDKHYLNEEIRPGQRVIFARFEMDRDQILRRGKWARETPVFMSEGYSERSTVDVKGDIIHIPGFEDPAKPGGPTPTTPSSTGSSVGAPTTGLPPRTR